jgi:hypothetical protein
MSDEPVESRARMDHRPIDFCTVTLPGRKFTMKLVPILTQGPNGVTWYINPSHIAYIQPRVNPAGTAIAITVAGGTAEGLSTDTPIDQVAQSIDEALSS